MSDNATSGQPAATRPARKRTYPPLPAASTGPAGRCPRCGEGRLFDGFLQTADSCKVCGLDFKFIDSGDGPAVFVILIVGFLVVGLALLMEVLWQPPLWLQMLILGPLTIGLSLGMIRPLKGWLIARQYEMKAAEGRVEEA
ncbi:DUF983 domain-containing protein [Amorphus coralli]|uniref:DUF983 domain-containing protein n=1 Tax=Amorphus coralli TaxID=340680 RepID=UPI00037C4BCC|nr:DUF983 domain-containing protein [Amorphus coralli]